MESKKILVIKASPRLNGNSDILADSFIKGIDQTNHQVKEIALRDHQIGFCQGCLACQNGRNCVIKDDANDIIKEIKNADVLVYATPVYFYQMNGQLKTLLDRTNPLFIQDYQFRDVYLLTTCADDTLESIDGTIKGLEGWIACFDKSNLKGVVKGLGIDRYGEMKNYQEILDQAFLIAKNL